MEWSSWPLPFRRLHCSLLSPTSATSADVNCSFAVINDPDAGMSNLSFWNVSLEKNASGRWLITAYGQG
jgi:hypothetical protein